MFKSHLRPTYVHLARRSVSIRPVLVAFCRTKSPLPPSTTSHQTDEHGIPTRPLWSVDALLTSYPRPSISPEMLERIHSLSALIPPAVGTAEHQKLTAELEELVKLVEAVKLVDRNEVDESGGDIVPDGRIWADGAGIDLSLQEPARDTGDGGRALLKHAARAENGLYVVETDKSRN